MSGSPVSASKTDPKICVCDWIPEENDRKPPKAKTRQKWRRVCGCIEALINGVNPTAFAGDCDAIYHETSESNSMVKPSDLHPSGTGQFEPYWSLHLS